MPFTALDPRTALVVIDLQKGILNFPTAHPSQDIVAQAAKLAAAFRAHGLPVVLVNVNAAAPGRVEQRRVTSERPPDWAELAPALGAQPSDHHVTKKSWGAFSTTGLEALLRKENVTQIVLCGIATSLGVESTARSAYELGFNVSLAVDAMTDMSPEAHQNSVTRIFPRLGETGTTDELIALLDHRG
jgi:nicotinamidase-related amidase